MSNSFTKKKIDLEITLKEGTFGETGTSTVRLSGLRVSADVDKSGLVHMGTASIRVWGLKQSMMNQLSTLGTLQGTQTRSSVIVYAGDENGMSVVFTGNVNRAWAEYQSAPDVPFSILAQSGLLPNIQAAPASSYKGPTNVATIMAELARKMGFKFENNGVKLMLNNPNLPGTYRTQAEAAARAARINWTIDDGVLAIWYPGKARKEDAVPTISPQTGLIGYPAFEQQGVVLRCLYNPAIKFGGQIKVESSLPPANGTWNITGLAHNLESETPGGQWFSTIQTQGQYARQQ